MAKKRKAATHTPGLWPIQIKPATSKAFGRVTVSIGQDEVCNCVSWQLYGDEDAEMDAVTIADARLISAAPALLAACEAALGVIEPPDDPESRSNVVIRQIEAAVAKARGK